MAVNIGGVTLLVLLLYCWQEAELQPIRMFAASSTELPSSLRNLDDDMAAVFDEILVQEMLDPSKSTLLETQRPLGKSTESTKKKKARIKMNYLTSTNKKHHAKQFSSGNEDRPSFNEEEKETIYQIKSLTALEKIIHSLRKALGKTLKQRKKHRSLFKGAKHHKRKQSLNRETETA